MRSYLPEAKAIDDHCGNHDDADDEALPICVHIEKVEPVAEDAHKERAAECAENASSASRERCASHHDRGNHLQFEADPSPRLGRSYPACHDDGPDCSKETGNDIDHGFIKSGINSGEPASFLVTSDSIDEAAEQTPAQDGIGHEIDGQHEDDGDGYRSPVAFREEGEAVRHAPDFASCVDDARQAAADGHGAQGSHEGMNLAERHEQAIGEPESGPHGEAHGETRPETVFRMCERLEDLAHDHRRGGKDGADGEVDTPGKDDESCSDRED